MSTISLPITEKARNRKDCILPLALGKLVDQLQPVLYGLYKAFIRPLYGHYTACVRLVHGLYTACYTRPICSLYTAYNIRPVHGPYIRPPYGH